MDHANLGQLLDQRAAEFGVKDFLFSETDGRKWTYSEFAATVAQTAGMLKSRGVGKGDVVSLLLPNSPEYIVSYFACWSIGAIAGPINSLLNPKEIEWAIANSESRLLIVGESLSNMADGIKKPETWVLDDLDAKDGAPLAANDKSVSPDDDAILIYTSGTTGKPKGCLLTHGNLLANARQITEWMGLCPEDRLLSVMPLFHMNAVTVTTMTALYCAGSTVVSPKFSASRFWDVVEEYKVTSFGSVATMLSMLLQKHGEANRSDRSESPRSKSLRFAMCGSAPVPATVMTEFEKTFDCLVVEGYGLSESTCRSTFNPPDTTRRPGSCGLAIGNEMKVFDEDDREVPIGERGEIVLRGPNIFKGYFRNPEATAKAFRNGWFHTGDVGYRDAEGFFYIVDRKSDMIIRGGENIYPREIDDLLYTHPAIAAAAVIGVPDELYGEEVAAFIVLKPGKNVTENAVIDLCKQHLAAYKCPKSVYFVNDIPKGPTGKLLKRELAERLKGEKVKT